MWLGKNDEACGKVFPIFFHYDKQLFTQVGVASRGYLPSREESR